MAMMRRGARGRGRGGISFVFTNDGHGISNNPLDLVRSEVAILKKLNHRNAIKLYEVLDDPDNDSLFMGKYLQIAFILQ
jgi:[calcium/calmodulin-dependent protein kinase] kinase